MFNPLRSIISELESSGGDTRAVNDLSLCPAHENHQIPRSSPDSVASHIVRQISGNLPLREGSNFGKRLGPMRELVVVSTSDGNYFIKVRKNVSFLQKSSSYKNV